MKKFIGSLGLCLLIFQSNAFAIERYSFGLGEGSGFSCPQSVQKALEACNEWLTQMSDKFQLTEAPACPQQYCTCTGGNISNSSCIGFARYDDKKTCEGPQRFKHDTATASGFGCPQARHHAITALYQQISEFSKTFPVKGVRLGNCFCNGGNIAQATCNADLAYVDCKPN